MSDDKGAPLDRRLMISAVLVLVVLVGGILIVVGIANGGDSETLGRPSGQVTMTPTAAPHSR